MTRKLLLTIALGATLAIVAAGSATSLQVQVGDIKVDVPTTGILPACADLSDNDGDGLYDLGDPGCSGALDSDEYNAPSGGSGGDTGGGGAGGGSGSGISGGSVDV